VEEWHDQFLALFPHRFDYIYARHPEPGQSPDWQTESRHPLSDRILHQGSYLFGVRFGSKTNYCVLDIDAGSLYHPQSDPLAIDRILAALEPIGLVSCVPCTSSYSGGVHLYLPFQQPQSSWEIATGVATLLENAGFKLVPGRLEVLPNPKPYIVEGNPSLFNAHRLPLQSGSYLLNEDLQPIWSSQLSFVQQWKFAQNRNALDSKILKQIIKQAKRKHYRISGKADKFLNDLNAEIEPGWTDWGQTNHLLGRITMRCYVFHHVLSGESPLEGRALVNEIVAIARSLPGYQQWCQHRHEIEKRAIEWARCIENSKYFHYGNSQGKFKAKEPSALETPAEELPSWNQQQSEAARTRIKTAIASLLEAGTLPAGATARFKLLTQCNIGGGSLYRHRDLWHPHFLTEDLLDTSNIIAVNQVSCAETALDQNNPTSLLSTVGGNPASSQSLGDRTPQDAEAIGSNRSADSSLENSQPIFSAFQRPLPQSAQPFNMQVLAEASRATASEAVERVRSETHQTAYIARMQQFLTSGDPILMTEALAWAEVNSDVLNLEQLNWPAAEAAPQNHHVSANRLIHPPPVQQISPQSLLRTPNDFSDLLVAISIRLRQLAWTAAQTRDRLLSRFGKSSQALLDDLELVQWLECLKHQE
jgi:hypothetical protein